MIDQGRLRRAPWTGIPLDGSLIDHDGEGKSRVCFSFGHHQLGGLVDAIVRTIPVDDHSVDAAADHVRDLTVNLAGIGGTVSDIHVVTAAKPQKQVSINLGAGAGVKQ